MSATVHELRTKAGDSEKITINLGYVDLGHIDLLVAEKFYSNRTDFIRTAIRNQLERHAEATKQTVSRKALDLGLRHYTRQDLEQVRAAGHQATSATKRAKRYPASCGPGRASGWYCTDHARRSGAAIPSTLPSNRLVRVTTIPSRRGSATTAYP